MRIKKTGYTRSFGTYKAKGKFLTYLDSDDLLFNRKILEILLEKALEKDVDIVEFMILRGNETNYSIFTRDFTAKICLSSISQS